MVDFGVSNLRPRMLDGGLSSSLVSFRRTLACSFVIEYRPWSATSLRHSRRRSTSSRCGREPEGRMPSRMSDLQLFPTGLWGTRIVKRKWRRRESNPRPQPHRSEPLQV